MKKIQCVLICGAFSAVSSGLIAAPDEGDRFLAYGQIGLTHDSNVLRSATDVRADRIRVLAGGIKAWMPFSLQRIDAQLDAQDVDYQDLSSFNYRSHRAEVGWDWRLTSNAGGRLAWSNNRRPVELKYLTEAQRDVTNVNRVSGNGFYRFMPEWQIEAGADRSRTDHTLDSRRFLDYEVDSYSTGFRYLPATGSSVALTWRHLRATYPNQQAWLPPGGIILGIDNGYRQNELNLSTEWQITALTSLHGNVGHVSRSHQQVSARDYSGYVGRLGVKYQLTGKVGLQSSMWREIGGDEQSAISSYAIRKGIRFEPSWSISPKLQARLSWQYERLSYVGGAGDLLGIEPRIDKENQLSIGVDYEWIRNSTLSLSFGREHRDSTGVNGSYDARTAGLSVKASY
ncbi:XrtB/PEP-CTERM-associated polysaccharide biosynthesis outer membrane protein EpsL [Chitinivorax sp. B]|uniref:XrtB/PEP-CTERM-associated polysaccharide biosynthesis outer membrane protein EpsL n=1 Tax=Chitinivorax sp. B TaxID=2502235 RepID=UPI0010F988E6|nr:XrtB/PEP-CTERM-associated polysaccharide biosynthesis outer membrane protein EpsL [Chitinivorax sp. B]